MHKLKLDLDSLTVETFETVENGTQAAAAQADESLWETTGGGPYYCAEACA
ncbi:MAG TPA: hypothetical protein VGV85_03865 [Longimicrobiaceae bacterium]|nr:hypothetical protein [Longimicrobiaceae bacterium]